MTEFKIKPFFVSIGFVVFLLLIILSRYLFLAPNQFNIENLPQEYYHYNSIIPLRGSIYKDRRLIAWSVRRLGLFINVPRDFELLNDTLQKVMKVCDFNLADIRKKCLDKGGKQICIKEQLTADEIKAIDDQLGENNAILFKKLYEKRLYDKNYLYEIGGVAFDDKGFLIGVNGLEKKYNEYLIAKQEWIYEVAIDKEGVWIAGTYKEIKPAIKGDNVILNSSFASEGQ